MVNCIFYILKSPGPVLFYSNYVKWKVYKFSNISYSFLDFFIFLTTII